MAPTLDDVQRRENQTREVSNYKYRITIETRGRDGSAALALHVYAFFNKFTLNGNMSVKNASY